MGMWHELTGRTVRLAGVSGTPTIPKGAAIINLQALPGGTAGSVTLPDGQGGTTTVTLPANSNGFNFDPKHTNCVTTSANQIVFTGTTSYFVEFMYTSGVSVVS